LDLFVPFHVAVAELRTFVVQVAAEVMMQ